MRERSKLPVLLTELTVMLLVFALCAAVCLSVFFSSRETARRSGELSRAAAWASSCAEVYVSARGDLEKTAAILGTDAGGGILRAEEGDLTLSARETEPGVISISVSGAVDGGEIFSLEARAVAYG